jgi:opacity protein-like surface antigen
MLGLGLSLLFLAATPAAAEEGDVTIGIGGSFAGERFEDSDIGDVDDSRTWTGQIGYRVNDYLTLELEYEQVDEFDVSDSVDLGGFTADREGDVEGWILGLNGKVFPIQSARLRPYLMGGVGYMKAEVDVEDSFNSPGFPKLVFQEFSEDAKGAVLQLGLGLDLQLSDSWFVELEGNYKFGTGDLDGLDFFTVGGTVQFRF